MKELKAVLHFADVTGMSVNLHFDQPGRPIIAALEENIDFFAEFVLATFEGSYQQFQEDINDVEEVVLISQNQGNKISYENSISKKIIQESIIENNKSIEDTNLGCFEPINKAFENNNQENNFDDIQIVMVSQNLQPRENENIISNSVNLIFNNKTINTDLEMESQINKKDNLQNNLDEYNHIEKLNNLNVNNTNQLNASFHNNENCVDQSFTTLVIEQMSKNCRNDNIKIGANEFHLVIPSFSQSENAIIEKPISLNNFTQSHIIEEQKNVKFFKEYEQVNKIFKIFL